MTGRDTIGYFLGNLSRLMREARKTPRQLSLEIGRGPDYLGEVIDSRSPPDIAAVYGLAGALKVDIADLLRPGANFGSISRAPARDWAEQVAEKALAGTLEESRQPAAFAVPTFDAVLSWWDGQRGLLTEMGNLDDYVEVFSAPDADLMRPVPRKVGRQSLAARELRISTVEQLDRVFRTSEPTVARSVALAHAEVLGGQPKLSFRSILIDLSTDQLVKLSYFRLLLPVRDVDGQSLVINYSKPVRRSEIGRESADELAQGQGDGPIFANLE